MPGPTTDRSVGSARRPRGRPARYSPDSLLELAVGVFNERGYDGTSMENLARAAGLTKSSIYHHVAGKEDLLRRAVSRALDRLFAVLAEPEARSGPAESRLRHVVGRTAEVLVEELPYVTLLLRVRGNTATEQWALERRRTFDRRVTALVRRAVAEGSLRDDVDPALVTRLVFGMVNSISEWYRPGRGTPDAVRAAVLSLAFDGLARR